MTLELSGLVQYIGALPEVIYPQVNTTQSPGPGMVETSQARLENQGQLNYGGRVRATWRF